MEEALIESAMEAVREAYAKGQSVYGETCTYYLILDTSFLDKPDFEGAKYVCAPGKDHFPGASSCLDVLDVTIPGPAADLR